MSHNNSSLNHLSF